MKTWFARLVPLAAAVMLVASPVARPVAAQDAGAVRPVAVVSIASVDEVIGDIAFLTESAGQGDFGKMVALLSGGYTRGMDKKRPLGMIVTLENDEPKALAFLPVRNLNTVLEGVQEQIGKPEDAGNGVLELGGNAGNPIYVKEQNGWAYVSQKANDLVNLPQIDPAAVLGDLTQNYTVAIRLNVGNVPSDMKKVAVAQVRAQFERQLADQLEQQPEEQRAVTERYTRSMMQQFTSIIEDTDQVTIGLQIDSQAGGTHLDVTMTARPDTRLAQQMALMQDVQSTQTGFLAPEAAIKTHVTSRISEEDIGLYQEILANARTNAIKQIENDNDLENEQAREMAKEAVNALLDVAQKTIEAGKLDAGAALFLSPEGRANLVAGGVAKDAARLEETFRKVIEATKNEPKAPQVTFDAAQHQGVRFHTLSLPIEAKEEGARKLFGDRLDVALGFGQDTFYAAFGPDGLTHAKQVLDRSKEGPTEDVAPAQFVVAMGPILKFASALRDDPVATALAEKAAQYQGQDNISLRAESIERGVRYRFEVEQGVLQVIGAAVKMMTNQGGNQQAPDFF